MQNWLIDIETDAVFSAQGTIEMVQKLFGKTIEEMVYIYPFDIEDKNITVRVKPLNFDKFSETIIRPPFSNPRPEVLH